MKKIMLITVAMLAVVSFGISGISAAPCKNKTFKTSVTEAGCKANGQAGAKDAWKKFVGDHKAKAKAEGISLNCKTCHESISTFSLKNSAVDTYKKLAGK